MTLPDATPEDVQEQQAPLVDAQPAEDELPTEATAADAAEQRPQQVGDADLPDEASEADVAEQRVEVSFDEEDAPIG
jgi:hypothetical protein